MAAGGPKTSFRPRPEYLGHLVVGSGDGVVLIEPEVAGELRMAAARAGGQPAAGFLYGHAWHDDEGGYTLVDGFALTREEAAGSYPGAEEVGWWRTAPGPAADGWPDPGSWPPGKRPDGVGLVVFADGTPPAMAPPAPRHVVQGSVVPGGVVPGGVVEPEPAQEADRELTPEEAEPDLEMTLRERSSRSGIQSPLLVPQLELRSRRRLKRQPGAPAFEPKDYVLVLGIILVLVVVIVVVVVVVKLYSAFH